MGDGVIMGKSKDKFARLVGMGNKKKISQLADQVLDLLISQTLTGAAANVTLTPTADYKEYEGEIYIPEMTGIANGAVAGIRLRINNEMANHIGSSVANLTTSSLTIASARNIKTVIKFRISIETGFVFLFSEYIAYGTNAAGTGIDVTQSTYGGSFNAAVAKITTLRIFFDALNIPIGSVIKLWGKKKT